MPHFLLELASPSLSNPGFPNVMSIEMHPKPMYLAQQNAKEESSEHNEESSAETFGKGINDEKVRKNYSLEVLFLEEDKASIDIDYPESTFIHIMAA